MAACTRQGPVMSASRTIKQPGEVFAERIVAVEGRGRPVQLTLQAGRLLVEAVSEAFQVHGFQGGTVDMGGVELHPFAYVMPALSKTGENAAFYSEVYRPAEAVTIDEGQMSFGRRDGKPFFHCHALWQEADGLTHGGHLMPDETVVAQTVTVPAYGVVGGIFEANPDAETNFKLFGPVLEASRDSASGLEPCFVLRLRPNQEFHHALEEFCRAHGLAKARLYGGVGSTIGARFEDGREILPFATEVYVRDGHILPDAKGALIASLDVGLIDYTGQTATGRLKRGDNPVLMTFELVLVPIS